MENEEGSQGEEERREISEINEKHNGFGDIT